MDISQLAVADFANAVTVAGVSALMICFALRPARRPPAPAPDYRALQPPSCAKT